MRVGDLRIVVFQGTNANSSANQEDVFPYLFSDSGKDYEEGNKQSHEGYVDQDVPNILYCRSPVNSIKEDWSIVLSMSKNVK